MIYILCINDKKRKNRSCSETYQRARTIDQRLEQNMRYILDVSARDLKLIRASIVNFQRSLEMSEQAEFDNLVDDLDILFFKLSVMKKEQINNKIKRKWLSKK